MKKFVALLTVIMLLISSVCCAYAISLDALPQVSVSVGQDTKNLKVGYGEDGGVTLRMPSGHGRMSISFFLEEGGYTDFIFFDHNGNIVWDSYLDSCKGFGFGTHAYSLSYSNRVCTLEVGSNVSKILVYCSKGDRNCTTEAAIEPGISIGENVGFGLSVSYGKSCSSTYYYASVDITSVREW